MNARLFDMFHDAGDDRLVAVGETIDVDFDGVGQIAIEQQRILAEHRVDLPGLVVRIARLDLGGHEARQRAEQIIVEIALIADDRHGAAAEHIAWAHDERQPKLLHDDRATARRNRRCRSWAASARACREAA